MTPCRRWLRWRTWSAPVRMEYDGGPVELPEVEWRRDLWFYVAGLDASGVWCKTAFVHLMPTLDSRPMFCL